MHADISWLDITARLSLAVVASGLIGLERSEHGRPAGLRTTILVCLAATVSMIQVNLLLGMRHREADSFAMLDLMRLPLGILSGIGFIGGGAILKQGNLVTGVTTAATLWFVTVMGLCFGGGQLGLGIAAFILGLFVVMFLRWVEKWLKQDRRALLKIVFQASDLAGTEICDQLAQARFQIQSQAVTVSRGGLRRLQCIVLWHGHPNDSQLPPVIETLASHPAVKRLDWLP